MTEEDKLHRLASDINDLISKYVDDNAEDDDCLSNVMTALMFNIMDGIDSREEFLDTVKSMSEIYTEKVEYDRGQLH